MELLPEGTSMRQVLVVACAAAALAGAVAIAQSQQAVTPPKAVYWVSADTTSGLGSPFASQYVQLDNRMSGTDGESQRIASILSVHRQAGLSSRDLPCLDTDR